MPAIVVEATDLTSPLFVVRTWALLAGCLSFSLVASMDAPEPHGTPLSRCRFRTFWTLCMFTWCCFFVLTFLIHLLRVIQFHSLIPVSWKNLTVSVAALGALMCLSASVVFSWIVADHRNPSPRAVAAAVASGLTFLAYAVEAGVICTRDREQRGYMASVPGLLKILQFWGGCQMIPLVALVLLVRHSLVLAEASGLYSADEAWRLWVSAAVYNLALLMSLTSVVIILGDCTGRCPLPFDRFLAIFSLLGVLLYMVATVICFTKVLLLRKNGHNFTNDGSELVVMETVIASTTLLAYTVDFAFSIKLLYDRCHT